MAKVSHKPVTIIGTGDYARALAKRLAGCGYVVTMGSRNPKERSLASIDPAFKDINIVVTSVRQSIINAEFIILAIPVQAHQSLEKHADNFKNKIVVDISNPLSIEEANDRTTSIAEELSKFLPQARVVKAFNTVSAYALEVDASITTGSRDVMVASNSASAKVEVLRMVQDIGYIGVDYGVLKKSKELERLPLMLFNGWELPTRVIMYMFPVWMVLGYLRYYYLKDPPYVLSQFPVHFMNKIMGCMGVTLLSACFLPGCIAAVCQIRNGTKYIRFSNWLDQWMKMRKQLGIYALMFIALHCCMSLVIITPAYFPGWFTSITMKIPAANGVPSFDVPVSSIMTLKGESVVFFGLTALLLMTMLGLTSVPAIANLLNWREWVFVQSQLGFVCLALAAMHVTVKGYSEWQDSKTWFEVVQRLSFQSAILPIATVLFKVVLLFPPINSHVTRIRQGWESRNVEKIE